MYWSCLRLAPGNIVKVPRRCASSGYTMPSPTYTVFRNAILREQQVICTYKGRHRELNYARTLLAPTNVAKKPCWPGSFLATLAAVNFRLAVNGNA